MSRVTLRNNAYDGATGRSYTAGDYEVVEVSENRRQMDASFASRAISQGLAEELSEQATDAAIEEAQRAGVDVTSIEGSGSGGKVTKQDVKRAEK